MKVVRHDIIKKYAKAFLHVYGSLLIKDDLAALSYYIDFIKAHKQRIFFAFQECILPDEKRAFLLWLVTRSVNNLRKPLLEALSKLIYSVVYNESLNLLLDILILIRLRFFTITNYQYATITTSHPLSSKQKSDIVTAFRCLIGREVDAEYHLNKDLIAGLRIISQNYMWERSIDRRIKALSIH